MSLLLLAMQHGFSDIDSMPNVTTMILDLDSKESIDSCASQVSQQTSGRLDVLLNNAGSGFNGPFADHDLDAAKKFFDANLWGPLTLSQALLPLLIAAGSSQLVFNGSVASVIATPYLSVYNAAKAATSSFVDTLRTELAPFGIRVIDLKTGSVESKFRLNASYPEIKEASHYFAVREQIRKVCSGTANDHDPGPVKAENWARQVVHELIKPNPPARIWKGGYAAHCYWVWTLMPQRMLDNTLAKVAGLHELARTLRQDLKKK